MALNVLIVDDSAVMRRMIARALELTGMPVAKVFEAGDGVRGLAAAMEHPIDLALIDINMPEKNGLDVLSELRTHGKTSALPVVMVSTEGSEPRIEMIRANGAAFVRKPFTPEALVAAIVTAVGGRDDDE
ncbi:MAG: response regulator [Polyangiaceae bacterium]|nr:response regulator [Polyangiaceae bacterium]